MIINQEDVMYIIAGLGNPGKEYMGTRHNAGFSVIDELADSYCCYACRRFGFVNW